MNQRIKKHLFGQTLVVAVLGVINFSHLAQADATEVTCEKHDERGNHLEVAIKRDNLSEAPFFLVTLNSRLVYQKPVEQTQNPSAARKLYFSPTFENHNHVPATLFLGISTETGQLIGQFSEVTYMPVLPREVGENLTWGMTCKEE